MNKTQTLKQLKDTCKDYESMSCRPIDLYQTELSFGFEYDEIRYLEGEMNGRKVSKFLFNSDKSSLKAIIHFLEMN